MSLFNLAQQALGALGSATGNANGNATGILTELLSGGGLQNLVQKFQDGGMGSVVASWISNGENQAITAEALQKILGNEQVARLAEQYGQDPQQLANQLAQQLPEVVNALTPNGTLPADGFGMDDVLRMAGSFLNRQG